MDSEPLEVTKTFGVVCSARLRLIECVNEDVLSIMSPFKAIALPVSVNGAAAVELKTIPPKDVPEAKLLFGEKRFVPSKARVSPGSGAEPPTQFAPVLKL